MTGCAFTLGWSETEDGHCSENQEEVCMRPGSQFTRPEACILSRALSSVSMGDRERSQLLKRSQSRFLAAHSSAASLGRKPLSCSGRLSPPPSTLEMTGCRNWCLVGRRWPGLSGRQMCDSRCCVHGGFSVNKMEGDSLSFLSARLWPQTLTVSARWLTHSFLASFFVRHAE